MTLTWEDHVAITDVIALHGHLCDSGEGHRFSEVFTTDVTYDVTDFGMEVLHGLDALHEAAIAVGDRNPVGHHVTNIVLTQQTDDRVLARSKGIGVYADGTSGSVTYDDTVVRLDQGWRIKHRVIRVRRVPLGG